MSENLKAFLAKVSADAQLIERLKAAKEYDEIFALAAELNMPLGMEDIEVPQGEMEESELETVNGGITGRCFCVAAGGGGGTNDNNDTYGCACVGYGQGGDGSADDFTCMCVVGGEGVIHFSA